MSHAELFLIKSRQDEDRLPHWMLMTVPALTDSQRLGFEKTLIKGVRYHSRGGPTENAKYTVSVQANTNFRSESVLNRERLCNISIEDSKKLTQIANSIQPHQCQKYVVCMLAAMQQR